MNRSTWSAALGCSVLALAVACGEKDGDDTGGTTTQGSTTADDTTDTSSADESDTSGGDGSGSGSDGASESGGSGGSGESGGSSEGGVELPPCENANDEAMCDATFGCQWDPGPPGRGMCVWACDIIPDEATCMTLEELCTWDGRACAPV